MSNKGGFSLIKMTIVLMVIYNIIYLTGEYLNGLGIGFLQSIYTAIKGQMLIFSILEALGAVSLFVDLVVGWDDREGKTRTIQTLTVIILILLFLFKFAMRALNSMLPDFG